MAFKVLSPKHPTDETTAEECRGLRFARRYTTDGVHPYDAVEWETRDAIITDENGNIVFEQTGVEFPSTWTQQATNVVANKYFRGAVGSPQRESSLRHMLDRVVDTITHWGTEGGYFAAAADAESFAAELRYVLLHQMACFNSPVWFNVGVEPQPQCSACFINSVEDTLPSILDLAKTEGMLFKYGSGTGTNLSTLRSSKEALRGGGTSSGPVSFMKGLDAFAGVIKSGGKTRRAAKMVILDIQHPDITEFIDCKANEEKKAWALIDAGYDGGFNVAGGAYETISFQNANNSVRVTDDFMRAVEADSQWITRAVRDGRPMDTLSARTLMRKIADATWVCGDPGMQFDTTINNWHTCPNTAPIKASNPCSEFMFLDDTACNLASLNLLSFYDTRAQRFDVEGFVHACEVVITAQEILVDNAGYPRPSIRENSQDFRPLGIGFANLGALLMARGLPYDSDAGRGYAGALTALMSGAAYAQSGRIAATLGAFQGFEKNREPMLRVMKMHRDALHELVTGHAPAELLERSREAWDSVVEFCADSGLRNAQISVVAPTGTIAFMMDCDTTGIEPDIALVKYKRLEGGGMLKMVNRTVPLALRRLSYSPEDVGRIVSYLDEHDTIEGAPALREEHLSVFDCALKPTAGSRCIHYRGHLEMLGSVQPFISGAISKTINMPEETMAEEIESAYIEGWKLGLKAIAIYRNGCKRSQPLSTSRTHPDDEEGTVNRGPLRLKLPDERRAITHKFVIQGHKGYLTVGLYEDGSPGEIFVVMAKEGSTISGLMDAFATSISIALQHRVPLDTLITKFAHTRFEPSGFTNNPQIPMAKSVTDYIFRWLGSKFLTLEEQKELGIVLRDEAKSGPDSDPARQAAAAATSQLQTDAPSCQECGSIMVRNGTCYHCLNCGATSGCG
ncbi:MAG: vitamin B12-dependent ribonucleotide reductase [Acidobacteria bacterium]|nr:vitamin B12-dependent ribonucleotide reductase [Acidobacteriota bacterium]